MRLLFITRKFPPMVGGMEKVSFALAGEFAKKVETSVISWGGSQKFLPYFLPKALFQALYIIRKNKITHVHLGDALLSPLGWLLKKEFGVRVSVTVHGLDMTYDFAPYQMAIPRIAASLDLVISVSEATRDECLRRGVPESKCVVIPNGIQGGEYETKTSRGDLEKMLKKDLRRKNILVTVGRLVERKGVRWFIEKAMTKLSDDYLYLVVGEGKEAQKIRESIGFNKLEEKVMMLGRVSQEDLKVIYNTADALILPNKKVEGDMEGFGVVAIEASSVGLPVIASRIEGIKDAVKDTKNGYKVSLGDVDEWIRTINKVVKGRLKKEEVKEWTLNNFRWERIGELYLQALNE